jgi:hypothetical protein
MKHLIAYSVVAMLVFASCALAPNLRTATLVGTVTDASGAAVANALVVVTSTVPRIAF